MRKNVKIVEVKPMLLPPAKDKCQECATKHEPEQPHNATSMFYLVKFKMDHGKEATWSDAMAHCSTEVKKHWTHHLKKMFDVDVNSTNVSGRKMQ